MADVGCDTVTAADIPASGLDFEWLDGIEEPVCLFTGKEHKAWAAFVNQELAFARVRMQGQDGELLSLPSGDPVFFSERLAQRLRDYGMENRAPLVEICLLSLAANRRVSVEPVLLPDERMLQKAISDRIHAILEQHPAVLHRKIRVAAIAGDEPTTLLRMLVRQEVVLQYEPLKRIIDAGGPGAAELQWQLHNGRAIGAPVIERALERGPASPATAVTIVRLDPQAFTDVGDEDSLILLAAAAGRFCALDEWQGDLALELLGAVQARQAETGHAGFEWSSLPEEILDNSFGDKGRERLHPVLSFLVAGSIQAASGATEQPGTFLAGRLPEVIEALNGVLHPDYRLPLSMIDSRRLAEITSICAAAVSSGQSTRYWQEWESAEQGPADMLLWTLDRPDAPRLSLADLDDLGDALVNATSASFVAGLRARMLQRAMQERIDAGETNNPAAAASPRQRTRMV